MDKISFFLPTLNFGGIEANTIRLAKSFQKSGFKVDLVVGKSDGDYQKRVENEINIINLNREGLIGMVWPLIRYIKKNKPDVLITGGEGANLLLATIKTLLPKVKVIISIRTNLTTEYRETKNKKKKVLFPFLSRLLYKKVDRIVTVSKGVATDASKFLGYPLKKFEVIYNPIVDEQLYDLMNQNVVHKWLEEDNLKVVLSVGRLVKQKDLPVLIKGFRNAREKYNDLKLIIIGDGPERTEVEKEIKKYKLEEDIDMIGFIQNPYPYMKKSDVFVLSSKWEGFGNVLVEALATGVPVVSTDCPNGPSEILKNGEYGSLIKVGDDKKLGDAILSAINCNNISDIEKRKNRSKYFSVDIAKEKYLKVVKSL